MKPEIIDDPRPPLCPFCSSSEVVEMSLVHREWCLIEKKKRLDAALLNMIPNVYDSES